LESSHTFVFVTGLHRSGTSPLHRCLRRHPQISGFHGTGVPEDEGQHLQTVLPRGGIYGGPGRFGRHPDAHWTERHPLATPETAATLFAEWRHNWDLAKPYLVEKTPITLLRTRFFQTLFPDSSFVVIVRHPVAVALATYNALASFGGANDLTVTDLIEHYLICHEAFASDVPHLQQVMTVRYEEFADRPQQTLDGVFAFLGLPAHPNPEEIEAGINDAYWDQWQTLAADPMRADDLAAARRFEPRVRRLGYSLEDWSFRAPVPGEPREVVINLSSCPLSL
jgi:hypothetical protein